MQKNLFIWLFLISCLATAKTNLNKTINLQTPKPKPTLSKPTPTIKPTKKLKVLSLNPNQATPPNQSITRINPIQITSQAGYVMNQLNSYNKTFSLAKSGNVIAMYNLAIIYERGQEVEQSDKNAYKWYLKAANKGDVSSQYYLGVLHSSAGGTKLDNRKALFWYRKAAKNNNKYAQYNLGWMYDNGYGVKQNNHQAFAWFRQAAEAGYAPAQHNVGLMLKNGTGISRNHSKARRWFEKCAAQNSAQCQYQLGIFYYSGRLGVPINNIVAYSWFREALKNGFGNAQVGMELILGKMSPKEITKADFYNPIRGLGKPLPGSKLAVFQSKKSEVTDLNDELLEKNLVVQNLPATPNLESLFPNAKIVQILDEIF